MSPKHRRFWTAVSALVGALTVAAVAGSSGNAALPKFPAQPPFTVKECTPVSPASLGCGTRRPWATQDWGGINSGKGENLVPPLSAAVRVANASPKLALGSPTPALCQGKKYTIGVDYFLSTDSFAGPWLKSIQRVAKSLGCVTVIAAADEVNPQKAVANMQTFVQRGANGVILIQVVGTAAAGVMKVLNDAHVAANACCVAQGHGSVFVSVPDYESAYSGGKYLAQQYLKSGKSAKPYVVLGLLTEGGVATQERLAGVRDAIFDTIPGIPKSHLITFETHVNPTLVYNKMLTILQRIPKGSPILGMGVADPYSIPMFEAIKHQGRQADALWMGLGGEVVGLEYVCKNPNYLVDVAHFPENWGLVHVPLILDQIHGMKVPQWIQMPWVNLTRANMHQYAPQAGC